jgi:hypothetical protein
MTIFITKFSMFVSLLIFIFCSFITIRSGKLAQWVWDPYVTCCFGEDVASLDSWFYLSNG